MGLSYCCCTAAGSLCNACLGSTAEGTTGRKRSVLLLTMAVVLALWFQYAVGPAIVSQSGWIWQSYRYLPGTGKMVYRAWHDGCAEYANNNDQLAMLKQCAGNAGVFRPMAVTTIFFAVMAVASKVKPNLNREVWPAKYGVRTSLLFYEKRTFLSLSQVELPCVYPLTAPLLTNRSLYYTAYTSADLLLCSVTVSIFTQRTVLYGVLLVAGSGRCHLLCALAASHSD